MIKKGTFIEVKIVHQYENKNTVDVFLRGNCLKDCRVGEFLYNSLAVNNKNVQGVLFIREER